MRDIIVQKLSEIETQYKVKILFAIESGSRAWGFASPDSDWDVRFIYAHEKDWYLSVENSRDVIEIPISDDLDICGWDVRKALSLFGKSNPAFLEWVESPITYLENGSFRETVRSLVPRVYTYQKGIYHYRSMAKTNYLQYLKGKTSVKLKKYFYILRPILAVRWILSTESPPPMEFRDLLPLIYDKEEVLKEVDAMLEKKAITSEMGFSEPIPILDAFIVEELTRLDQLELGTGNNLSQIELLNDVFRSTIQ